MTKPILVCRTCSTPLGNDPQERALGFCSGRCARDPMKVARCEKHFLGADTRAWCVLDPGHSGVHQAAHGFTWLDERPVHNAEHAAWNNHTIRQPNGPVTAGKYLSPEELAKMAGEGGNADTALGRAVDSVEKAVKGYHDLVRTADSTTAKEMLGMSVPAPKRICACCPKVIGHANPHAVFCSSMCAKKAAEAYMSRPRTTVINTPPQMFVAAERALGFIAGLNLQDHSVKEQRESLEVVRALQTALRPEKARR